MLVKDVVSPLATLGALNATAAQTVEDADHVGIQITGTWAGTVTFQGSVDGTNFVTLGVVSVGAATDGTYVTTTTANGAWVRNVGGLKAVRCLMSAYTSGTASVAFIETRAAK